MFTSAELKQIKQHGLTPEKIKKQIATLKQGDAWVNLERPALLNDGINNLGKKRRKYIHDFQKIAKTKKIVKFVPASGAATRMFQVLYEYRNNPEIIKYNKESKLILDEFISCLNSFPFYPELKNKDDLNEIFNEMFARKGLNYLSLPKALILFHRYGRESRTAFEEHIIEGLNYTLGQDRISRLHFTISPEHRRFFTAEYKKIAKKIEKKFRCKLQISYSIQNPATDTVALVNNGQLCTDQNKKIVFRPGGHGALLTNLNQLQADIVVIKNIDNVAHDWLKETSNLWQKILIGYCLDLQQKIFNYLKLLKQKKADLQEIKDFLLDELNVKSIIGKKLDSKKAFDLLNRPLRICGMVRNQGEPGGGPFWVKDKKGLSLQIVEKDQISVRQRLSILKKSRYFNPVNLVCAVRDYQNKKFDLMKYCDQEAVIITNKYCNGKQSKVLEYPGLWNGGMAYWNTVFVEMPIETFTPVKTVNDLLRPEHQPK